MTTRDAILQALDGAPEGLTPDDLMAAVCELCAPADPGVVRTTLTRLAIAGKTWSEGGRILHARFYAP